MAITIHSMDLIEITDPMARIHLGHSFENDQRVDYPYRVEWVSTCSRCGATCQIVASDMMIRAEYINTVFPCSVMISLQTMKMAGHNLLTEFETLLNKKDLGAERDI